MRQSLNEEWNWVCHLWYSYNPLSKAMIIKFPSNSIALYLSSLLKVTWYLLPAPVDLKAGPPYNSTMLGLGSDGIRQQTYSGSALCQCPHLLSLFTNQSYYLFHVGISLGCGRIRQMGWKSSFRHNTHKIGQMGSSNQPLGLEHMDKAGRKIIHHYLLIGKNTDGNGQIIK